jgi:hypothetical protein
MASHWPPPDGADARAPNALLMLLEGRAPMEFFSLVAALPWLARLPRGDGHPVLVFPGMGASDITTVPLRRCLQALGYVTQAWGQGFNFGPRPGVIERSADDLRALAEAHDQPVSLIGWSLGGIYARELAREVPELVRAVVTLGSPFSGDPHMNNVWHLYEWVAGHPVDAPPVMHRPDKPPVPTLAIWSSKDGIVAKRAARGLEGERDKEVEIGCSHMAFGISRRATRRVAREIGIFLREIEGASPTESRD